MIIKTLEHPSSLEFFPVSLLDDLSEYVLIISSDHTIQFANSSWVNRCGFSLDEFEGKNLVEFLDHQSRLLWDNLQSDLKLASTATLFFLDKNGISIETEADVRRASNDMTLVTFVETKSLNSGLPRSRKKNFFEKLSFLNFGEILQLNWRKMRNDRVIYQQLFQHSHDAIMVFDPDDEEILEANDKVCDLYGFHRENLLGRSLKDFTLDIEAGEEKIKKTLIEGTMKFTTKQVNRLGRTLVLEVYASVIQFNGKNAILTINKDITSRYELSLQLQDERKLKVRALVDGQELERRRIAQELHDGIGQMLMSLIRMMRKIHSVGSLNKEQNKICDQVNELTENTAEEVRRISKNLMPSILVDFGLEAAMRSMLDLMTEGDLQVEFICDGELPRLKREIEIGIYRIVQESVANVIKHSQATNLTIHVDLSEDRLIITIEDNGVGFDSLNKYYLMKGNGLANMFERAEIISAKLSISSNSDQGCKTQIEYPLNGENKDITG